ncbi:MAG TPA: NAD(P)-binding domain-containing protein [Actinomycetota bacterium]|nr:NAD(P)-binding domain-containing protein [Actinomycetota bacterium]
MRITIVGAGNMGRGIGIRAVGGGHQVEIVDHDPAEAQKLAGELGGGATALEPGAPFGGQVVVFAVYYPGIKDAVQQYADQLDGKVVVDITNPLDTQTWDRLATPPGSSSAEEVQQLVPQGTPVVKAFNTTFAGTLADGQAHGQRLECSSPATTRMPSSRSRSWSPTVACARSTPARSAAPSSWSSSACCTSRCSSRATSASAAPSGCTRDTQS